MPQQYSILADLSDQSDIAFFNHKKIGKAQFILHIARVREQLPSHQYCFNLCEDRYLFLVLFVASMSLQQINLLPSSRAKKEIQRLEDLYPDSYKIDDDVINEIIEQDNDLKNTHLTQSLRVKSKQTVVIVFTSGTTGLPKPNAKTWGQLKESAKRVKQRFGFNKKQQHSIVATVPPQHMFGFETTIIYPLLCGVVIHAGRPFYPLDVQQALEEMPEPRVLISIPLHLKSSNSLSSGWPHIDFILSATAPMSIDVARASEHIMNTRVMEIYGCSEVGAIATRQMTKDERWHLLEDFNLIKLNADHAIMAPEVSQAIQIPDQIHAIGKNHFNLIGRESDLINIGGKRGSIANINKQIKEIEGVDDAVIFLPEDSATKRLRLMAFVVTNVLDSKTLRELLAERIDAVFLPRPIIIVERLPYNNMGKLTNKNLWALLNQYQECNIKEEHLNLC